MLQKNILLLIFGFFFLYGKSAAQNTSFFGILEPFKSGVEKFNSTLEVLLNYNETDDFRNFLAELFTLVKQSHDNFSKSEQAATLKHDQLSSQEAELQAGLDSSRKNLQQKGVQKQVKETELEGKRKGLEQAEKHLANTEKTLRDLEAAVRTAEQKVDDARHCLHRKKRGWFKKTFKKARKAIKKGLHKIEKHVIRPVVKPIAKPIEKAVCAVYNKLSGELKKKKRLRDNTRRDAENQRNSVNEARQAVTAIEKQINSLNQAIIFVTNSIKETRAEIQLNNDEQSKVNSLKATIGQVNEYLAALSNRMGTSVDAIKTSQAALIVEELGELVDFAGIFEPILNTGLTLGDQTSDFPSSMRLSQESINMIQRNIARLKEKTNQLKERYGNDSKLLEALEWDSEN